MRRPTAPVLGTPWTSSATKVALLGAGEIGKEVAIALTRLGVEVTAIDRYEGAPAQQVAHNAMTVDMSDPEALTAAIRASGAAVVIPEIEALATDALAGLESAGEVQVVPTARAVQLTMNREGIRRLAAEELGLATSPYAFASCLEELVAGAQQVGFAQGVGDPGVLLLPVDETAPFEEVLPRRGSRLHRGAGHCRYRAVRPGRLCLRRRQDPSGRRRQLVR